MPLIDIGIDSISSIIREFTKGCEDAFQEAWIQILESEAQTQEDIKAIAQECYRRWRSQSITKSYKEKSFDAPLTDEPSAGTLHDIFPSPELNRRDEEIDAEIIERYVASSSGKINKQGHVHLDYDVYLAIKTRFPHDPLNHAIRKLANMPPPNRSKLGWHRWEDEIVKVRYPWGGARAVMLDVYRTETAIVKRAKHLGVIRGKLNGYKPHPDWLNIQEVGEKIGKTEQTVARYIKEGVIQAIRIPEYHQGHDGVFVTPQALEDYNNRKELLKQEHKRKQVETRLKTMAEKKLAKREAERMAERMVKRKLRGSIYGYVTTSKRICMKCDMVKGQNCMLSRLWTRCILEDFLDATKCK